MLVRRIEMVEHKNVRHPLLVLSYGGIAYGKAFCEYDNSEGAGC